MRTTDDAEESLRHYEEAERIVYGLISGPPSPAEGTPRTEIRRRAVERLDRLRAFLTFIGNPQQQFKSIHVGGTSGKGSTSAMIASILTEAGYRSGLHVSPYLQVATEKLIVDGRIASARRYHELVTSLNEAADRWTELGHDRPTYGEFWVAMTFMYFAEEAVDYAVIEVGAGGRFDLTNVIQPQVAAITSVGFDHIVTLGPEITDIAWHKAGIIKPGIKAVTAVADPEPLEIIRQEAAEVGADLLEVHAGGAYRAVQTRASGTSFTDGVTSTQFDTSLPGTFQAANAALALAAARALPDADIPERALRDGLLHARFPGRMEVVQDAPAVMLDGAHNPQKIEGLSENLGILFPDRRIVLVFGVLESKSFRPMLDALLPLVSTAIATSPRVYAKPPVSAAEIAGQVRSAGVSVDAEDDPLAAIEHAIRQAGEDDVVLVTGSLYLVGNIRERWYPMAKILSQGTIWPE